MVGDTLSAIFGDCAAAAMGLAPGTHAGLKK